MTGRRPAPVLLPTCIAVFLVIMDATIVAVALPAMGASLGLGSAALPWVVNAYTLVFAGCLLLGGRIVDLAGPRRTLLAGLVLFAVASAAGGLAPSALVLFTARAVQGLGGALLMPATLAVIMGAYPAGWARTRALATWSMVGAVGATAGTLLGGILTQWAGWRSVLLVAVSPAVLAVVLAVRAVPHRGAGGERTPLDVVGAVLITCGLGAVVYAVMQSQPHGWGGADVLGSLLGGLVLLVVFAVQQSRWAAHPLVPPGTLHHRGIRAANAVMFAVGLAFFATPVLLVVHLQVVDGYSPAAAGFAFAPVALALLAGGRLAGPITERLGPRCAATAGLAVATAGFAGLAFGLSRTGGYLLAVCLPGVVLGLGVGEAFTPLTVAATDGVPPGRHGLAAGILNTTRQLSGALGLAVLSTLALVVGYGSAMALACAFCALATSLTVLIPGGRGGGDEHVCERPPLA